MQRRKKILSLAAALRRDKDALICDFAQYYGILDFKGLPPLLCATLAEGLPDESRSKRKAAGVNVSLELQLLAGCFDRLSWLCWSKTKNATKHKGAPESVLEKLLHPEHKDKPAGFSGKEEFEKAWERLCGGKE